MLWIMYEFNRNKKSPFEQKLAHFLIIGAQKVTWATFWAQKLTEYVSFWAQKLILWVRDTISRFSLYSTYKTLSVKLVKGLIMSLA
jgi:hypothetical protein